MNYMKRNHSSVFNTTSAVTQVTKKKKKKGETVTPIDRTTDRERYSVVEEDSVYSFQFGYVNQDVYPSAVMTNSMPGESGTFV